ncbi:MAG: hypothetical protein WC405_21050, partial [Syntrophales bacterium]
MKSTGKAKIILKEERSFWYKRPGRGEERENKAEGEPQGRDETMNSTAMGILQKILVLVVI